MRIILEASTAAALEDKINKLEAEKNGTFINGYQVTPITEYRNGQPQKITVKYSALITYHEAEG